MVTGKGGMRMYNIKTASIDITYRCNLRCKHCFNFSGVPRKQEMTDEELRKLAKDLSKLNIDSICLCGGETLYRYELVCEISSIIKKNSPQTLVNIVTNGILLTKEKAMRLKNSGIHMVQISLDGFTDESYDAVRQSNGCLSKVFEGIINAKESGLEVSIATLPHKKSLNEFEKIIDYCHDNGLYELRAQPLMPLGRGKENYMGLALSWEEYEELKNIFKKKDFELKNKSSRTEINWGDPVDHYFMLQEVDYLPFLTINAYGEIEITPYLPFTIWDLKEEGLPEFIEKRIPEKVLAHPLIKKYISRVYSIEDMYYPDRELPRMYLEDNLNLMREIEEMRV